MTSTVTQLAASCQVKKSKNTHKKRKQNHAPWFDRECQKLKTEILKLGQKLKNGNCESKTREKLYFEKRKLKKIVKKKKFEHKKSIIDQINTNNKNPKLFWKLLDKLSVKNTLQKHCVQNKDLVNYFHTKSRSEEKYPIDNTENGPLDYVISMDELKEASSILKPGKSPGIDEVDNEMILCLFQEHPRLILKLFNKIYITKQKVLQWSVAIISLIYKNGAMDNPANFRGISLLSCLGKFFYTVLNNRLIKFVREQNILSESQLGFIAGNRTSDAHILLYNLIQKYCHKNKKMIFSCFVDFQKAFDNVPREILLKKLLKHNINGNMFAAIKNLYSENMSCVKMDTKITEMFGVDLGVKQGCVLSPMLFNIFLADLPLFLGAEYGINIDQRTNINSIIWADDILLLAETEEQLQGLLYNLERYCEKNGLTLNTEKTKIMIFNKTGRHLRRKFWCKGNVIETVRKYKYLGFVFTPSGEINTGLCDLYDRALKAYMNLRSKLGQFFRQNIQITLKYFDSLIKPILLYCSDFWGCLKLPKNNPIEKLHNMCCKNLLDVQKQTSNIGTLLELDRIPLTLQARKNGIKNWERIKFFNANRLVKISYENAIQEELTLPKQTREIFMQNGMLNLYECTMSYTRHPSIFKKVFQRLVDQYYQESFSEINQPNSKLRTYSILKSEKGFESYLYEIKNLKQRMMMSKLRLSNHKLMIEKGRHKNIPKELRFCLFCPNKVEDEVHFILECQCYSNFRTQTWHYTEQNKLNRFKALMTSKNLLQEVARFVEFAFDTRSFLINKPKRRN